MEIQELKNYYEKFGPITGNKWRSSIHKEFKDNLIEKFSWLNGMGGKIQLSVYVYALLNDIDSPPLCEECGTSVKNVYSNKNPPFPKYCSNECSRVSVMRAGWSPETKASMECPLTLEREYEEIGVYLMAKKYDVGVTTVYRQMEKMGVTPKEPIPHSVLSMLKSPEDFTKEYQEHGAKAMAMKYSISEGTIRRYVKHHGVKKRGCVRMSDLAISVLNCPDTLSNEYYSIGASELARKYDIHTSTIHRYMEHHNIERDGFVSGLETSFRDFLYELGVNFVKGNRDILGGLEIDFYIPDHNIGFELNGVHWHSSKFKEKTYHLKKTETAADNGVSLFHIYEDEWNLRRSQWKRKVKSLLNMDTCHRIGARKTTVEIVKSTDLKDFMDKNHIQGFSGGFLAVQLVHDGDVVAGAIFRKDPQKNETVHLNRYATSKKVPGGLSKIMKHVNPILLGSGFTEVISFADRGMSDGGLYKTTGWSLDGIVPPDYRYVIQDYRVRKQNFRRSKLPIVLGDKFDPSLTEKENMERAGIPRIYDCGLYRYSLKL